MADSLSLDFPVIKRDLLRSYRECSLRGLRHSAKWAAELVYVLRNVEASAPIHTESLGYLDDTYHLAKGYLDLQEYDRAAFFAKDAKGPAQFLHYYARYLSDEKKRLDDMVDPVTATNRGASQHLKDLQVELGALRPKLDGFGLYIYGVVLKRLQLNQLAIDVLVEAAHAEPLHWGTWVELSSLIKDRDHLLSLDLPDHWIKHFFLGQAYLELQLSEEALKLYERLQQGPLRDSTYLVAQVAVVFRNMWELDKAIESFCKLQQADPCRVDNMDTYSNVLCMRERRDELAQLAHRTSAIDRYRPETCCIVGNLYSLRKQHVKAVPYFDRALRLNPNYFIAWTLMGHEYLEMRNTKAAVQAYRRAIEVNPRDHRAWFGLGQAYGLLKMPAYCLYYYRLAEGLNPIDPRMTIALGEAYEKLDKQQEAKKCFWRARSLGDFEGLAVFRLACVYQRLGEHEQACKAFTDYVQWCDGEVHRADQEDLSQACCFLAKHHLSRGQLEEAHKYAQRCTEFADTREEAKSLLKQVAEARASLEQGGGGAVDVQIAGEDDHDEDSLLTTQDSIIAEASDMDFRTSDAGSQ